MFRNMAFAAIVMVASISAAQSPVVINDPNPAADNAFGAALDLVGTSSILIGAPGSNYNAPVAGAAYLFSTAGNQLLSFSNPSSTLKGFGMQVAAAGDKYAIAAGNSGNSPSDDGRVYVFNSNGTLALTLASGYSTSGRTDRDYFGFSMCAVGTRLIVSCLGAPIQYCGMGSVFVFETDSAKPGYGSTPVHTITLPPGAGSEGWPEQFGVHLAAGAAGQFIVGSPMRHQTPCNFSSSHGWVFDALSGALVDSIASPYSDYPGGEQHCLSSFGNQVGYLPNNGGYIVSDGLPDIDCSFGMWHGRVFFNDAQSYICQTAAKYADQNTESPDYFGDKIAGAALTTASQTGWQFLASYSDENYEPKIGLYASNSLYSTGPARVFSDPVNASSGFAFGRALDVASNGTQNAYAISDQSEIVSGVDSGAVYIWN